MGENPVALKSELLMSICEQQMGEGQLGAFHKSIIDRCAASVYHDFIKSGGKARQPILSDWRNEIKRQPEREAQELALASELFVEGSLNMFAHETNVDIDNRIIVFDLYEMGDQLKPTALNVTMETIQNRVATNRLAGKYTWVFVDEVYLFFKYYYSAQFLYKAWKRFRKYGAALTAATQNVEECLRSETARLMFANSEFLVLLNQAATDRAELAKLLNISETRWAMSPTRRPVTACSVSAALSSRLPTSFPDRGPISTVEHHSHRQVKSCQNSPQILEGSIIFNVSSKEEPCRRSRKSPGRARRKTGVKAPVRPDRPGG